MLAALPEDLQKLCGGADNDDFRYLFLAVLQLHPPDDPHHAQDRLRMLQQARNYLNAVELDHLKVLKQIEESDPSRIETASDWLTDSLHMQSGAAYARVRDACQLEEFPNLDREVHAGALTQEATGAVLDTLRRVRKHLGEEEVAAVEQEMLVAAREMDHSELRKHGSSLFHLYDRAAHNRELREEREKRFFSLRRRYDGWFSCEGLLDPEGGTLLQTALKAIIGKKKAEDDERTPGQTRADALTALAEHRLAFGDLPEQGQEKPHLTIVVDAANLRGDEHTQAPRIDWGTPVSGEMAKRAACDAIARIAVVGDRGDGIVDVLHMGRAFRTTNVAQRKALDLQDGGCIWCGRAVRDCTPHHWEAWSLGGRTDLENLGLVCGRHHFALHEGGYRTAEVTPDRVVILRPDGSEYRVVPRHRWNRIRRDGSG